MSFSVLAFSILAFRFFNRGNTSDTSEEREILVRQVEIKVRIGKSQAKFFFFLGLTIGQMILSILNVHAKCAFLVYE